MAASNKCVIVLAPNGRRQNVKVTPNTTILQILEEVCKKQGFKAEEYEIKHHNHLLDISGIMRFSGLPNNAQLEMAPARKTREESSVCLGLQLESGVRLTGDFLPTESLWNVIKQLCPDEADPESNPVIIYMRREVYGATDLESTTLRSLGLTGGRAMLRLVHRTPEQLHQQANVYHLQKIPSSAPVSVKRARPSTDVSPERPEKPPTPVTQPAPPSPMQVDETPEISVGDKLESNSYDSLTLESLEGPTPLASEALIRITSTVSERRLDDEPEIILLGERNAVVFNLAAAPSILYEDLPEDFFDLTLDDARALYRDIKRRRAEIEEAPLVTAALRDLEESSRVLTHLNIYKRAVLRIQFPDRTVLQGTFIPLETIGIVMEFVKNYLEDPRTHFHLFTTPPKRVLSPDDRLVDIGCVPSALLHFGLDVPDQAPTAYLKQEVLSQFTSLLGATLAACQSRGIVLSDRPMSAPAGLRPTSASSGSSAAIAGPSRTTTSGTGHSHYHTAQQDDGAKVPKWFKPSGK